MRVVYQDPQTCTTEKNTWGPSKRDVTPKIVMSTTVKHTRENSKRKKLCITKVHAHYTKQEVKWLRILLKLMQLSLKDYCIVIAVFSEYYQKIFLKLN